MKHFCHSSTRLCIQYSFLTATILTLCFSVPGIGHAQSTAGLSYIPALTIGRGAIRSTAWQSNSGKLAVGTDTGIWLYDTGTTDFQDSGYIETIGVLDLAWSPDGRTLVALTSPKCAANACTYQLSFWNTQTLQKVDFPTPAQKSFNKIAWSPDGMLLAEIGAINNRLMVWNVKSGRVLLDKSKQVQDYHAVYSAIEWSPDSKHLAALSDYHIDLITITTGKIAVSLATSDPASFYKMAWSPNGQYIATLLNGAPISVWDTKIGMIVKILPLETQHAGALAWDPSGKQLLLSIDGDLMLYTWLSAATPVMTFGKSSDSTIELHWNGNLLLDISYNSPPTLWDTESRQPRSVLSAHESLYRRLAWSPDSTRIATINTRYQIMIWDAFTGHSVLQIPPAPDAVINNYLVPSLVWSPDGTRLVSVDQALHIWDAKTGKLLNTLPNTGAAVWSPDSQRLATDSAKSDNQNDPRTVIIDAGTGQTILQLPSNSENAVSWSSNGKYIITSMADAYDFPGYTKVWDVQSGTLSLTLDSGIDAQFSPNNRWLASSNGSWLQIREPATGFSVLNIPTHANALAWHPASNRIATNDLDNRAVNIWDVNNGQPLGTIAGISANGAIGSLAWSPDGRQLADISDDRLHTWRETGSFPMSTPLTVPVNAPAAATTTPLPVLQPLAPAAAPTIRHSLFAQVRYSIPTMEKNIRLSPDGQYFAVTTSSPTNSTPSVSILVDVYRVDTGEKGFGFLSQSWSWSPNSQLIVSLEGVQANLINTANGIMTSTLVPPVSGYEQIVWSPDSKYIAVTTPNSTSINPVPPYILAASTLRIIAKFSITDELGHIAWSPDSRLLALSNDASTHGITIWDVSRNSLLAALSGIGTASANLFWSPDSHHLATIGTDTVLSVWSLDTPVKPLFNAWNVVYAAVWSHNGQRLAADVDRATVRVWNVANGHVMATVYGHSVQIFSETWSPDDRLLFTMSADPEYPRPMSVLWDVDANVLISNHELQDYIGLLERWLSNDTHLLIETTVQTVVFWRRGDPHLETIITPEVGSTFGFNIIAIDGELFSTSIKSAMPGTPDNSILSIRRLLTNEELLELDHAAAVDNLEITPDAQTLITTDESNILTVWHIASAVDF